MPKLVVSITNAKNNTDSATVGFVVANAGVAAGQEVYVWLSIDGVFLSQKGYADGIHVEGFKPLAELIDTFVSNGGQMLVCPPCFKARGLAEDKLMPNTVFAGGARLVEILGQGAACISY
jgi:predicted peroxiredoxin